MTIDNKAVQELEDSETGWVQTSTWQSTVQY